MLQEYKEGATPPTDRNHPLAKRTKERTLHVDAPTVLAPVTLYTRDGPQLPENAVLTPPPENDVAFQSCENEHLVWFISRYDLNIFLTYEIT